MGLRARPLAILEAWPALATQTSLKPPGDLPVALSWRYLEASLHGISFPDSLHGWAVGDGGTILATSDGGRSWSEQKSGVRSVLNSAHFPTVAVGWFAGSDGVILTTNDGGTHWHQVPVGAANSNFKAISFATPLAGFAITQGAVFATRDGGRSWRPNSFPETSLVGLATRDADTAWVAGNKAILKTTDGGETWKKFSTAANRQSICMADALTGWAVGSGGTVLATTDGGEHWLPKHPSVGTLFESVSCISPESAWIGGPSYGPFLGTVDGGRQWTLLKPGVPVNALVFTSPLTGWIASDGGAILATQDGGHSWRVQHAQLPVSLTSVRFVNSLKGWAVGYFGTILATADGGHTWKVEPAGTNAQFAGVFFINSLVGWVVGHPADKDKGAVLLSTIDGGENWKPQDPKSPWPLNAVRFLNATTGYAVGGHGTIRTTLNGGRTWTPQNAHTLEDFNSVFFTDPEHGWAVGDKGVVATTIGGRAWSSRQITNEALRSVVFLNPRIGWAVGGDVNGLVFATSDGGKSWQRQSSDALAVCRLLSVYFLNATTGWATGSGGDAFYNSCIVSTTDGGETWSDLRTSTISDLNAVDFSREGRRAWVVGDDGNILMGTFVRQAAYGGDFKVAETPLATELSWQVAGANPEQVDCPRVDYRIEKSQPWWHPIEHERVRREKDRFLFSWNPGFYAIQYGSKLEYRISIQTKDGLVYRQVLPGSYPYRTWWRRQSELTHGVLIAVALAAAYLLACLALLWLRPLALLWLSDHLDLANLLALGPTNWLTPLLSALFASSALQYFATHDRTRRAWIGKYLSGDAKFDDLRPPVLKAYARAADCLDAWVEMRKERAQEGFAAIKSVSQRPMYIELPLRIGSALGANVLAEPSPESFRPLLARPCAVLAILGEGGAGKTTLACQLGRWALADDPAQRLAPFRMIPVFLAEEATTGLLEALTGHLRRMVGEDEVTPDLINELLRAQRILVIVDALSERSAETQARIEAIHAVAPVNALLLTSRRPPDFGPTFVTPIRLESLSPDKLVYFVTEYLRRTEAAEGETRVREAEDLGTDAGEPEPLFRGREPLILAGRLLDLFEVDSPTVEPRRNGRAAEPAGAPQSSARTDASGDRACRMSPVTPLLVRLFVDQAIDLRKKDRSIDGLPKSIPELILQYLRLVNPEGQSAKDIVPNDVMIDAARILGWTGLGNLDLTALLGEPPGGGGPPPLPAHALAPGVFYRGAALEALRSHGFSGDPERVIDRLIANGILIEDKPGGTRVLHFNLDPVAEHLAALHLTDTLRGERTRWQRWLTLLPRIEGFPQRIVGFLHALEVCIAAYREAFAIPAEVLPWLSSQPPQHPQGQLSSRSPEKKFPNRVVEE